MTLAKARSNDNYSLMMENNKKFVRDYYYSAKNEIENVFVEKFGPENLKKDFLSIIEQFERLNLDCLDKIDDKMISMALNFNSINDCIDIKDFLSKSSEINVEEDKKIISKFFLNYFVIFVSPNFFIINNNDHEEIGKYLIKQFPYGMLIVSNWIPDNIEYLKTNILASWNTIKFTHKILYYDLNNNNTSSLKMDDNGYEKEEEEFASSKRKEKKIYLFNMYSKRVAK